MNNKLIGTVFSFMALMLFSALVFAESMTTLYQTDLPVVSQRDEVRADAIRQGLQQVLVRLTSNPDIASNPTVIEAQKKAESFVQSYHYRPSNTAGSYKIQIQYDKEDIAQLLKQAGIPFWGETRPLIMVWLVAMDSHGDQIVGADEPNVHMQMLLEQSQVYGLPMIFPVMDVADMHAVTPKDIVKNKVDVLNSAATRYSPDALLIGQINQVTGKLKTHWKLVMGSKHWDWSYDEKNPKMLAALLLNQISSTLSRQMVQRSASAVETEIHLRVTHVTRPADFKHLTQFFKSISTVQHVQLEQVSGDTVDFTLLVQGGLSSFQENAAIGKLLELRAENDTINQLVYEWKS